MAARFPNISRKNVSRDVAKTRASIALEILIFLMMKKRITWSKRRTLQKQTRYAERDALRVTECKKRRIAECKYFDFASLSPRWN